MDREAKRRIRRDIDTTRPLEDEMSDVLERAYDKEDFTASPKQIEAMEQDITTGRKKGFLSEPTTDDSYVKKDDKFFKLEQRGRNHFYAPSEDAYYRQMKDGSLKKIEEDN